MLSVGFQAAFWGVPTLFVDGCLGLLQGWCEVSPSGGGAGGGGRPEVATVPTAPRAKTLK